MHLINLDATTRRHMVSEINRDIAARALYLSPRLSWSGQRDYPRLLLDAAETGDDASLAAQLRGGGRLNAIETATRNGKTFSKRVPVNAPETLAEGEFNRFYVRGLCLRAMEEGAEEVIVYRAKAVTSPRPTSEAKIGSGVSAARLLEDLRVNRDIEPALGIPAGAGSGLSIRLPT
jgi:hypothetical protein